MSVFGNVAPFFPPPRLREKIYIRYLILVFMASLLPKEKDQEEEEEMLSMVVFMFCPFSLFCYYSMSILLLFFLLGIVEY